jgi:multiple sugar transport system substrate-binding protein
LPPFIGDWEPYLLDLTPYANDPRYKFDREDLLPVLRMQNTFGKKIVGQTYDGDYHLYIYRKDWFADPKERDAFKKKYGRDLSSPKTWDEYLEIAQFFQRPDEDKYGDVFWGRRGYCWPWWYDRFSSYPGSEWFDDDMNPGINAIGGIKSLENFVACRQNSVPAIMSTDYDAAKASMFKKANVAQIILWPGAPIKANTATESNIPGKIGFDPLPGWEIDGKLHRRFSVPAGHDLAISKDSKHKDAAAWVISFVTGKEAAITTAADPDNGCEGYRFSTFEHPKAWLLQDPARNNPEDIFPEQKGVLPTGFSSVEEAQHYCEVAITSFSNAYPQLNIPGQAEYLEKLDLYVNMALDGTLSPKEALDKCAKEWDEVTDAYGREFQKEFWTTQIAEWDKVSSK